MIKFINIHTFTKHSSHDEYYVVKFICRHTCQWTKCLELESSLIQSMTPHTLRAYQKGITNTGKPHTSLELLALKTKEEDLITFSDPEWLKVRISAGKKVKFNKKVIIKYSIQTIPWQSVLKVFHCYSLNVRKIDYDFSLKEIYHCPTV